MMFINGKRKFELLLAEAVEMSDASADQILSASRKQELVCWRQLISLVLYRAGMPIESIAECFDQHRTNIINSVNTMKRHERKSPAVADIIKKFSDLIK